MVKLHAESLNEAGYKHPITPLSTNHTQLAFDTEERFCTEEKKKTEV